MRARIGVCAHHHFESGRSQGHLEHRTAESVRLFHRSKAFFGVVAQAEEPGFELEIVWEVEADVGIEPDAVLGRKCEWFLSRQDAMFDGSEVRPGGSYHGFGALRVDHCPQTLRTSFAAGGIELFLGEGRPAAIPDAGRREDLDQIRTLCLLAPNVFAKLLRCQPLIRHLVDRGEVPVTGAPACCAGRLVAPASKISNQVRTRLVIGFTLLRMISEIAATSALVFGYIMRAFSSACFCSGVFRIDDRLRRFSWE